MHTSTIEVDGITYRVHHNSDWSGEAIVAWRDKSGAQRTVELPGRVLAACGRRATVHAILDRIADLGDDE